MVQVLLDNKAYPCRPTMGAMLRFKRETGKEVTEITENSLSELCTYLWCCVVSACKCDGVEFDMPLMGFADHITPDVLNSWVESMQEESSEKAADVEKKSK